MGYFIVFFEETNIEKIL